MPFVTPRHFFAARAAREEKLPTLLFATPSDPGRKVAHYFRPYGKIYTAHTETHRSMSAGAVFKLIANDGKADRMIMATSLLNQRIADVTCARRRAGKADTTPTIADLERTHIVYVNAHFKPFAAIGCEYNKVRPQSGNPALGGGVTFSIPQFGDFFHDMVCRTRLSRFSGKEGTTPARGTPAFPNNPTDVGTGISLSTTAYRIVDAFGTVVQIGADGDTTDKYRNFVRYCEYPGNRLFKQVKFDVNGNPLDQYDEMVPVMLEKFCTPPNKRTGYNRLVGQEVPLTGYGGLSLGKVLDADVVNTPAGITRDSATQSNQTVALFEENVRTGETDEFIIGTSIVGLTKIIPLNSASALNNTGTGQFDVSRQLQQVVNGPQTPKPVQPPLEIWNKLRFWFNDDVRLSIASVSIPFGQRFISIELCPQSSLAFEFPSIYLEKTVSTGTVAVVDTVTGDGSGTAVQTVRRTYTPIFQQLGIEDIAIEKMELYINNLFVNPEVHDIYIKRIGFSLIRVYRQHTQRCNQESSDEKLLSQLKWPIEYMFVGLRPAWNTKPISAGSGGLVTGGNQYQWRDWHRLTRLVPATVDSPMLAIANAADFTGSAVAGTPTIVGAAAGTITENSSISKVMPDEYYLPVPTVDSMTLTSHGITIFDSFSDTFFNQYLPFHYGGSALVTPEDPGALFVNMALFPRSYQPSGHLNISRARETYLKWTTSYVSAKTPAELHAVAVAINFLLITDGSAVLRYST